MSAPRSRPRAPGAGVAARQPARLRGASAQRPALGTGEGSAELVARGEWVPRPMRGLLTALGAGTRPGTAELVPHNERAPRRMRGADAQRPALGAVTGTGTGELVARGEWAPRQIRDIVAALVLASAVMVSGCTGPGSPGGAFATAPVGGTTSPSSATATASSAPSPTVVDGVGLEILQSRTDYAKRGLQLSVTNTRDEPIVVVGARFDSVQFAAPVDWSGSPVEIPPGLTRHLPIALSTAVCPAPEGPPVLTLIVRDGGDGSTAPGDAGSANDTGSDTRTGDTDGSGVAGARRDDTTTIQGTPSDPFGVLPRIAGEDCLQHEVAATAALGFAGLRVEGSGPRTTALLELRISPTGAADGPVLHLTEVRPSILLQPRDGGSWPLDLEVAPGDSPSTITLEAVPARCDPHAVAEDKRGTVLPLDVTLAGRTAGTVELAADPAVKQQVYDFISESCGFATG
ncbi:hypothetical protein SCB71_12060 [Herbiconiux sp. KACC 21604]|uniref:hypothetical protein n=1 Tax=unclassified Herbiconiux TaxID=2618217 RepID=UPI001490F782|nr:hypothetical protein [Herbiconiux sp. SALV-R1]QJU53928.1 hypothetical protein HL652_10010 [Herbiconiux sp. SALV-R1]WPO84952.1 hypothetical protein SCB71_12060 [Herbiconiux sp. KACC 21604]